MEEYKLSSINSFHTKSRYPYQGANCRCPGCHRKPFQKYDVFLPSIIAPIKPYTSRINHSPYYAIATPRSCYHLISSSKIESLRQSEAIQWNIASNARFASCPCCNVCCDSSFMLQYYCDSSFTLPLLTSHMAWSLAPAPVVLEVTSAPVPLEASPRGAN
jgi:hypothetical protein